jgi:membrane-bound lytic murein transglycosylase D
MSADRLLGYPLAILGGFALLAPRPGVEAGASAVAGAGGTTSVTSPVAEENTTARGTTPQNMVGDPSAAVARPTSAAPLGVMGRPSAESAELRALRLEEGRLFPELGPPSVDVQSRPVEGFSCEQPSYDMAQSVEFDIPATKDWLRGLNRPAIAVPRDQRIAKYIRYFAATPDGRQTFAAWLSRSGRYREIVATTLEKKGLPIDLMAVMFVESGCWPTAISSAGAVGLWQFMPKTARAYGLVVNSSYDERRSIWRSTEAAATHLADLHAQFNSWHLALAAYNYGYQQMVSRVEETHTEDFFLLANRSESLPRETALYVPKVLAVAVILRNLEYFGFDAIEQKPPISAAAIEVPPGTRLSLIARASGTSLRQLKELNPELSSEILPDPGGPMFVHLPTRGLARAKTMLPKLLDDADREHLDLNVTSDFDWGRDEFDTNWHSRLQRTTPQGSSETTAENKETGSDSSQQTPRGTRRPRPVQELDELESSTQELASTPEPLASAAPREAPPAPVVEVQPKAPVPTLDMTHLVGPLSISGDPWARLEEETGTGTRRAARNRRSLRDRKEDATRPTSRSEREERGNREERLLPSDRIERVGRDDRADVLSRMERRSGNKKTARNDEFGLFEREPTGLLDRATLRSPRSELAYTQRSRSPRGVSKPVEFFYEVKPGDTLSELAVAFNVSQRGLISANRLRDPSHILAGSRIRVVGTDARVAER